MKPLPTTWCEPVQAFFAALRPRRIRSILDFAEQEVIIPSGPRAGFPFRADTIPWARLILNEYMSPRWRRKFLRGSVQSGKTFLGYVLPALYHMFERQENVIFGAPDVEMAWSKFNEEILPAVEETAYRKLLPRLGAGSRGGKARTLKLLNGVRLRFMGAGGGDQQRSSYTAPVIILTEIDKMDTPGQASREADPVHQFEARATAFGDSPHIYGECTTSIETGRIYQETTVFGSDTRIFIRCPHCRGYLYPQRDQLTGWRDAATVVEAHERAAYVCQLCGVAWSEADRSAAVHASVLVHKGQKVTHDGQVTGPYPQTYTLGVVWNCVHALFVPMGMIAEEEWRAEQTPSDDSIRRKLSQFHWALPFKETVQTQELTFGHLAARACDLPHDPLRALSPNLPISPLPAGVFVIGAVDVQKRQLYITADAFDPALTRWTILWHVVEIVPEESVATPTEAQVRIALDTADHILTGTYRAASLWIDANYKPDAGHDNIVRQWVNERGDGYNALVGRGSSQMTRMTGKRVALPDELPDYIQCRLQDDGARLWFLDVDKLKDEVHGRLFRSPDVPGAHWFARDAANTTRTDRSKGAGSSGWIFSHYMRVKRQFIEIAGRMVRVWKEQGRHDLFDCAAYAYAGALVTQAHMPHNAPPGTQAPEAPEPPPTIRTKY